MNKKIIFSFLRGIYKEIINYLMYNREGASKAQLSDGLNLETLTVLSHLEKLERYGIVLNHETIDKKVYFLNERYYYEVLRNLFI